MSACATKLPGSNSSSLPSESTHFSRQAPTTGRRGRRKPAWSCQTQNRRRAVGFNRTRELRIESWHLRDVLVQIYCRFITMLHKVEEREGNLAHRLHTQNITTRRLRNTTRNFYRACHLSREEDTRKRHGRLLAVRDLINYNNLVPFQFQHQDHPSSGLFYSTHHACFQMFSVFLTGRLHLQRQGALIHTEDNVTRVTA